MTLLCRNWRRSGRPLSSAVAERPYPWRYFPAKICKFILLPISIDFILNSTLAIFQNGCYKSILQAILFRASLVLREEASCCQKVKWLSVCLLVVWFFDKRLPSALTTWIVELPHDQDSDNVGLLDASYVPAAGSGVHNAVRSKHAGFFSNVQWL